MSLKLIEANTISNYEAPQSKLHVVSQAPRVGEVMSAAIYKTTAKTSLSEAWQAMLDCGTRHLPVVESDNRIIGVISDRDLGGIGAQIEAFPVSQVMSNCVVVATEDTSLLDVAAVMINKKIGSVPVVGEDRMLLGVVTRTDILKVFISV